MKEIAIDGPAGAGKSTVAKALAKTVGYNYLDTGAMYRAAAYYMMKKGVDPSDAAKVVPLLEDMDMRVEYEDGAQKVFVGGADATPFIRTPEVSWGSSAIAVIPEVRLKLTEIQRGISKKYDIVMDGRDIGTYVLPGADRKFYLTADSRERARRRLLEMPDKTLNIDEVERDIIARDKNDMGREFAPLKRAEDAVLIDTTGLDIEEVLAIVIEKVNGG